MLAIACSTHRNAAINAGSEIQAQRCCCQCRLSNTSVELLLPVQAEKDKAEHMNQCDCSFAHAMLNMLLSLQAQKASLDISLSGRAQNQKPVHITVNAGSEMQG